MPLRGTFADMRALRALAASAVLALLVGMSMTLAACGGENPTATAVPVPTNTTAAAPPSTAGVPSSTSGIDLVKS